jgi:hypothetical protein
MKRFLARKKNEDLQDLKDNIGSGYASQREPATGIAIVKMLEEARSSGRGSLVRDIIIILIALATLIISILAYLKMK